MTPKQPPLEQIIAELIESFGAALGLVTAAVAKQTDAEKLRGDLQAQIAAATATRMAPPLAIRLATHALAAADAECKLRQRAADQATH